MKFTEIKEVVHREEVITGRKCDFCGKDITREEGKPYNYLLITTHHHDWGNDSCDSYRERDCCSLECALPFIEEYLRETLGNVYNTKEIEIEHVMSLSDGAD